jgi:hypothetical protein
MLALVALIVLGVTGAAEAKGMPPRIGPDLAVDPIDLSNLPTPAYLIEKSDGSLQHATFDVTVTNVGNRRFVKTKLEVEFMQGPLQGRTIGKAVADVPALRVGQSHTVTVNTNGFTLPKTISLYPIRVVAFVNPKFHPHELHFGNNVKASPEIPVIAQQWNVSQFSAHTANATFVGGGPGTLDVKNQTQSGFYWKYDHFDHGNRIFVYTAHGAISETATLSGTVCSGTGSGSASHATWSMPDTDFAIDYGETHYNGTLFAKSESPFSVPLHCTPASPPPLMQQWLDITTYANGFGGVSTHRGAKTLSDNGTQAGMINFGWTFTADVP